MRTLSQKAQSDADLQAVIQATQKLWRRHHLTYDQTHYVAKEVRRALELEQPHIRTRVIERLSRDEERRLIDTAYRLTGTRGLLIKTLFQTGARVSEFVAIEVRDFLAHIGFQGRGLDEVVPPDFCHDLFLKSLIFQWP